MKKLITYTLLCLAFLGAIFYLHQIYLNTTDSAVESAGDDDIVIIEHNACEFSSHLPLVFIETDGQRIRIDHEIYVKISLVDNGDMLNYRTDDPTTVADATIKYRGSSSHASFDKKQYRIEFKKSADSSKTMAHSVCGMPAGVDWVLNGPFLDRSLSRNYLGYYISRQLLPWAPDTRYCEVFIDDVYQGLYMFIEPITSEPGRLNLTSFSLLSGRTAYIMKMERTDKEDNPIITYGTTHGKIRNETSIGYPTPSDILPAQYEFIKDDFSEFEEALYSDYFDDPNAGYAKYIDVDTFVDYFIICEFMMLTDAGDLSTYLYKDIDSKLYITTWDFNNCYDNLKWSVKDYEKFYMPVSNWFDRLTEDRNFVDKVIARYYELREGLISEENLFMVIDSNIEYLDDAINRNFDVWGYTFSEQLLGDNRDPDSFEEAVFMLKNSITIRGNFMDSNIESLYDFCVN